jgi:site-specific DNA-methyltransferase (cytosine-N4-specific)
MPWRVAFALQADGWYLRQDIIWAKPCPMPESVRDRCTKAHEYIFLLTKRPDYYYDADAIKEPVTGGSHPRGNGVNPKAAGTGVGWGYADDEKPRTKYPSGWDDSLGTSHKAIDYARAEKDQGRAEQGLRDSTKLGRGAGWRNKQNESFSGAVNRLVDTRNKRSVWTIPPEPYPDAHYATFPSGLVRPCILAGSRPGDLILDPFGGSGTVGAVAIEYGRNAILIDVNPANERLMLDRMAAHAGQSVLPISA